jgi:hypothetical protein
VAEDVLYLRLCAGCARTYGLPYPPPQRQLSDGRWMEPEPWFCQRPPCRKAEAARAERLAAQARIGRATT